MYPPILFPHALWSFVAKNVLSMILRLIGRAAINNPPLEWPLLAVERATSKSSRATFGTLSPVTPGCETARDRRPARIGVRASRKRSTPQVGQRGRKKHSAKLTNMTKLTNLR